MAKKLTGSVNSFVPPRVTGKGKRWLFDIDAEGVPPRVHLASQKEATAPAVNSMGRLELVTDTRGCKHITCSCSAFMRSLDGWCDHLVKGYSINPLQMRNEILLNLEREFPGVHLVVMFGIPRLAIPVLILPVDEESYSQGSKLYSVTVLVSNWELDTYTGTVNGEHVEHIGYVHLGDWMGGVRRLISEWLPSLLTRDMKACDYPAHVPGGSPLDRGNWNALWSETSSSTKTNWMKRREILRDLFCLASFNVCVDCFMHKYVPF